MIFCNNCKSISFNIFEKGTIMCINCCRIYKMELNETGNIMIKDTGIIK